MHSTKATLLACLLSAACDAESYEQAQHTADLQALAPDEFVAEPVSSAAYGTAPDLELVAAFNPLFGETPESVAVTRDNSLVISMALTGELRKIDPDGTRSTLAVIPLGPPELCQGPFPGIMGALAVDPFDNVFVGASACDLSNKGIWRVSPDGDATLVASLPPEALPNGIAYWAGYLYVADSGSTRVWRTFAYGEGGAAQVWADEPLLADPNPFDAVPGANGLQFFGSSIYVANAGAGTIVEIPFTPSGFLGTNLQPEDATVKYGPSSSNPEHVTPAEFPGCDDFAFDLFGVLYCTTDPFQSVVRLSPVSYEVLWTAEDGLDGPTAATFGRGHDWRTLYISNAQFPFFPPHGQRTFCVEGHDARRRLSFPIGAHLRDARKGAPCSFSGVS